MILFAFYKALLGLKVDGFMRNNGGIWEVPLHISKIKLLI